MNRLSLTEILFSIAGLFIILFIIYPLLKIIVTTSPSLLIDTFYEKDVLDAIWVTFSSALWATLISCLSGIPLAYIISRKDFPMKNIIQAIIDLPVVIPHTSAGIALLMVFGKRYIGGKLFKIFGIDFIGTIPGIVIAMI